MSAATSAEAVGIYRSVPVGDDAGAPKPDGATTVREVGLPDTRVPAGVGVLGVVSFC